jgi:hypothetical protein
MSMVRSTRTRFRQFQHLTDDEISREIRFSAAILTQVEDDCVHVRQEVHGCNNRCSAKNQVWFQRRPQSCEKYGIAEKNVVEFLLNFWPEIH